MKTTIFMKARKTIRDKFISDPDLKDSYIANVAMVLYDELSDANVKNDMAFRNYVAGTIIDRIFSE